MNPLNPQETEKLKRFVKDEVLVNAVIKVFYDTFLKRRDKDVHYLAAKALALEFLEDAKKEFNKYLDVEKRDTSEVEQIGL